MLPVSFPISIQFKALPSTDATTVVAGYIGGGVFQRILQHPDINVFDITVIVRDSGKAKLLETNFGVKTVVGSMEELDKLSQLAEKAHIVVQCVRVLSARVVFVTLR